MGLVLETLSVKLEADAEPYKKGLDSAEGMTNSWGSKVGGLLKGAVLGGAAVAAGAVVAIGTAALDVSSQVDTATADIAASLGIPTAEAERFSEVARQVYGNNFADSVTDAAEAVKVVAQQLKLAGDDPSLKQITEHAFRLRDAFGVDVNESVSAAKTLMENFGLSGDEAFDMLAAGYQKGLDRSGDFLDTIGEYSTQFSNGGASASDFFSLMESGLQGGMLGTDKAADAFKEFRIRIMEGTGEVSSWLDTMEGTVDSGIIKKLRDGSVSASDAFELVIEGLSKIEDPVQRHKAGIALMGTQYEDLGDSAVMALTLTKDWAAGSEGAITSLDAKYNTFGSAVEGIWRRLVVSVSPFTDKLLDLVNAAMPTVMAAFDAFDQKVVPVMTGIGSAISNVVSFVKGLFQNDLGGSIDGAAGRFDFIAQRIGEIMPYIQTIVTNVLSTISQFWAAHGETIMAVVGNLLDIVLTSFQTTLDVVLQVVKLFFQVMTGDWQGAGETVMSIVRTLWDGISQIFQIGLDTVRTAILAIDWLGIGRNIIEGIANGISNAAGIIADAARNAAQSAYEAARSWLGIGSPSKVAAEGIGEPFAEGVGVGAKRGLQDIVSRIDSGLSAMMGSISTPQSAMAGAGSVVIEQHFHGPADRQTVYNAAQDGLSAALRSQGLR